MHVRADYVVKMANEIRAGELIRHEFGGVPALSIVLSADEENHDYSLGVLHTPREELTYPFWVDHKPTGIIISHGCDWLLELTGTPQLNSSISDLPSGVVAVARDHTVMIFGNGKPGSFSLNPPIAFSLEAGEIAADVPRLRAFVTAWTIWASPEERTARNASPIHRFGV